MNVENVKIAIAVMKRAQESDLLYMDYWQYSHGSEEYAATEEQLHACGNKACFAGYLAVSKEFRDAGGSNERNGGSPVFAEKYGVDAIAAFLGVGRPLAAALTLHPNWYDDLVISGTYKGSFYPVSFFSVKANHVIEKLEELLALGEKEMCSKYGLKLI